MISRLAHRATDSATDSASASATWALNCVDASLLAAIVLAPLFFGGRHDLGRLVLTACSASAVLFWIVHQSLQSAVRWRPSAGHVLAIAAVAITAMQLVPLPQQLLAQLAPRTRDLLPLWFDDVGAPDALGRDGLGVWSTLSLAPGQTRIALAMTIAYGLLFTVALQRLQSIADVERMLRMIALVAAGMAIFGLLQYFLSNGLFFWFYEVPSRSTSDSPTGPFTNRNHFAHFLALGIGPLGAWLAIAWRKSPRNLPHRRPKPGRQAPLRARQNLSAWGRWGLLAAFAIVLLAGLSSLSRGGALALAIALSAALAVGWRKSLLHSEHLVGLAGVGVVVIGLLSLHGYERVSHRLDDFTKGSIDEMDQSAWRRTVWSANVSAIRSRWLTGAGAGSHADVYPIYMDVAPPKEFTHAESSYLQIATECGLPGIFVMAGSLFWVGRWCIQAISRSTDPRSAACAAAVAAGLAASAVHACFDFVWHIPACLSVTLLMAACAARLAAGEGVLKHRAVSSQFLWNGASAATVCTAFWAICALTGPARAALWWDSYQLTSKTRAADFSMRFDPEQGTKATARDDDYRLLDSAIAVQLRQTLDANPRHARAHLRMATLALQQFNDRQRSADNAMSAAEVRDTAIASAFASRKDLNDWLGRAFPENARLLYLVYYHARRAVELGPLQGEAYLVLSQVCELWGGGEETVDRLIEQARILRPNNGDILFEAGRRRILHGEPDRAPPLWAKAYQDQGPHQLQMIALLPGQIRAADFVALLQPDWRTLRAVWRRYRANQDADDLLVLADYAEQAAEKEALSHDVPAAQIWLYVAMMREELGQLDQAVACARRAHAAAPSDWDAKFNLGRQLWLAGLTAEAEPHLRWCLTRRPENQFLQQTLKEAVRAKAIRK